MYLICFCSNNPRSARGQKSAKKDKSHRRAKSTGSGKFLLIFSVIYPGFVFLSYSNPFLEAKEIKKDKSKAEKKEKKSSDKEKVLRQSEPTIGHSETKIRSTRTGKISCIYVYIYIAHFFSFVFQRE